MIAEIVRLSVQHLGRCLVTGLRHQFLQRASNAWLLLIPFVVLPSIGTALRTLVWRAMRIIDLIGGRLNTLLESGVVRDT